MANSGQLGKVIITELMSRDFRDMLNEKEIKEKITDKIRGASSIVFLIGNDTHSKRWIQYEYDVACSLRIKRVAVQVPGTTGGLPVSMSNCDVVTFAPSSLRDYL